jgi:hypothetical protein
MAIAAVVALGGVAISHTPDTLLALGGAVGGIVGWMAVAAALEGTPATRLGGLLAAAIGLGVGGLFAAGTFLEPSPTVEGIGMALVVAGVFASPVVGESLSRRI